MLTLVSDVSSNPVEDLVSAFERALDAVKSNGGTRSEEAGESIARRIIVDFDALNGPERDQVAQAVTQLWDAFNERFDGLHGFLASEFHERYTYVKQLERAAERMAPYRFCSAAHYYRSTVLMLTYIKTILQQQSLGSRVVEAVHRGRVLSREVPSAQNAERMMQAPSPSVMAGSAPVTLAASAGLA